MLIAFELLFIIFLAVVLFMILKNEGLSVSGRTRKARVEGYWAGKDRRQHPRFTKVLIVEYSVLKFQLLESAKAQTVDISEGGAKIMLDEKLPAGTTLALKIHIPETGRTTEIAGDVVWTVDASEINDTSGKRFFYSGIKFSTAKEPSGKDLISYIRSIRLVRKV